MLYFCVRLFVTIRATLFIVFVSLFAAYVSAIFTAFLRGSITVFKPSLV